MYAQEVEGDAWRGNKIDKGKIDKMSGALCKPVGAPGFEADTMQTSSLDSSTSSCRLYNAARAARVKARMCLELSKKCSTCSPENEYFKELRT